MENNITLRNINKDLKFVLAFFLITLSIGIFTGLGYIYLTTSMSIDGTVEHYNGLNEEELLEDDDWDSWDEPVKVGKYVHDMLNITHAHIISFTIINLLISIIFYFNTIIKGLFKRILMFEPFFATIITFSSLWLMRYVNDNFVYIVIISAMIMYCFWYIMIAVCLIDLFKSE